MVLVVLVMNEILSNLQTEIWPFLMGLGYQLDWKELILKLQENHDKYDGFIILHGTDTLAYTASALSFFLKDWNKPIIVTGSQIPLFEFRNDAFRNIINSFIILSAEAASSLLL